MKNIEDEDDYPVRSLLALAFAVLCCQIAGTGTSIDLFQVDYV